MKTLQEMALPLFNEEPDLYMMRGLGGNDRALMIAFFAVGDADEFSRRVVELTNEDPPDDAAMATFKEKIKIFSETWYAIWETCPLAMSVNLVRNGAFEALIEGNIDYSSLLDIEAKMAASARDRAITSWLEANPYLKTRFVS